MTPEVKPEVATPPKKLLDRVRDAIRVRHYSIHTGAGVHGTRSYILKISVHWRLLLLRMGMCLAGTPNMTRGTLVVPRQLVA